MEYVQGLDMFRAGEDTAVTLGKFDGLHAGHQKLVSRIRAREKEGMKSVIVALDRPERAQLLTAEERRAVAQRLGVDFLLEVPLTDELCRMEPEEFVRQILTEKLHARYLAVGTDFRFGRGRSGDGFTLQRLQEKYGFQVEIIPKELYCGREISSTYVREELAQGHLETVTALLGYPYFLSVCTREGTDVICLPAEKLLPPDGLYRVRLKARQSESESTVRIARQDGALVLTCPPAAEDGQVEIYFTERLSCKKKGAAS